jgi:hypothetical protein
VTTFAGVELLLIAPNLVSTWGSDVSRVIDLAQNQNGNVITTTRSDRPAETFALSWGCLTRAALLALTAVLDARQGQLLPLWIPTYQRDVEVDGFVAFTGMTTRTDRTELVSLIMTVPAYHSWYFAAPGGGYRADWFNNASDYGDGTQNWARFPGDGPAQVGTLGDWQISRALGTVVSRLRFCRMARDEYRVSYRGKAAIVEAEFREIPAEAP